MTLRPTSIDPVDSYNTENPKEWEPWNKRRNFCIIPLLVFFNTFASTIIVPSVPLIMRDLGSNNYLLGNFIVSIYELGQIIGPLLLLPLSNMYGRRKVYFISTFQFIVFNISCALAPSTSSLIASVFLQAAALPAPSPLAIAL